MSWIIGLIIALSLSGNVVQHNKIQDLKAESEKWQDVAQSNYQEWQRVIEINEGNSDVIHDLQSALDECSDKYSESVRKVNDFKASQRVKDSAISQLKDKLDRVNFGTCRVPDWVDLTAS